MKRKETFRRFLKREPNRHPEGRKKEAVEKVFFFSDSQFAEICEDLVEEIERREEGTKHSLEYVEEYAPKRNTIREQLSLLEQDEIESLVEDTLLVLCHKHPESEVDRLQCLNKIVSELQEIVASNTPASSPAAQLKSLEKIRRDVSSHPELLPNVEALLRVSREKKSELHIEEVLLLLEEIARKERQNSEKEKAAPLPEETKKAILRICKREGSKEYKAFAAKSKAEKTAVEQKAFQELVRISQRPLSSPRPSKTNSLKEAAKRTINIFEEIEVEMLHHERADPGRQLHETSLLAKRVRQLLEEKPRLIKALKEKKRNTLLAESLPSTARIRTEQDVLHIAQKFYDVIMQIMG